MTWWSTSSSGRPRSSVCSTQTAMQVLFVICLSLLTGYCDAVYGNDRGPRSLSKVVCEDGTLVLECPRGEVLRTQAANYGRFTRSVCNEQGDDDLDVSCTNPNSKQIISEMCDGKQRCEMLVNNDVFVDPCPSTSKYLEVLYNCQHVHANIPNVDKTTTSEIRPNKDVQKKIMMEPPSAPTITHVESLSATEIEIRWISYNSERTILATSIFYTKTGSGREPLTHYVSSGSSYVLQNLEPHTSYDIYLMNFNDYAKSPKSNLVRIRTLAAVKKTTSTTTTTTTSTTTTTTTEPPAPETIRWSTAKQPSYTTSTYRPHQPVTEDAGGLKGGGNRARTVCKRTEVKGVIWPRSQYGEIVKAKCPNSLTGESVWACLHRGWDKKGPDYSDCTHTWLKDLDTQIEQKMRSEEDMTEVTDTLRQMVRERPMNAGDLRKTVTSTMPQLVKGMHRKMASETQMQRKRRLKRFKEAFVDTSSSLISPQKAPEWRQLSQKQCVKAATSLMMMVEDTGYQTAAVMDVGASDVTIDDNIVMEVNVVDKLQTEQGIQFPSKSKLSMTSWKGVKDSIYIPGSTLRDAAHGDAVNVVFTIYKNMADLIQPSISTTTATDASGNTVTNTISDAGDADGSSRKVLVNTNIIAASIGSGLSHVFVEEPIQFTLHHLQETKDAKPLCSFWVIDESAVMGSWSQEGCRMVESNSSHTTCECDHLTNFAVLMDISGQQLTEEHELALVILTYVCCSVSIVCLFLSWITFAFFKNLQCDRNTIHKNLVLSLMVAQIIFLAGIAQTDHKLLCSIIAGFLHYFFLASFAWMCLEGVQLYVMLVEVFELERSRVKWYYLFGYGLPLVIVGVSAAIKYEGYGTGKYCWLSTDDYFVWSFIGPALAVIMINVGMLSIAICIMCRHSNVSATMKEQSKTKKIKAWMKGAAVLVILLGLTWVLGVFYLNQESIVMAYAFTVLNASQGAFIFFFHCLWNEKVQKEYRKVARRTSWLPNCIRVKYGGYAGVTSTPSNSSGSGNYLSKLFGRRKQSATSTNSSMKPFLNKDQHRRSGTTENSSSSSGIPSSLNGYVYTPHYNGNNNQQIPYPGIVSNNNGVPLHYKYNGYHSGYPCLEPCYETVGEAIAGELSEFIDCSVVDSEMVSEYCKNSMQVCNEQRRYSTGSENSGYEVPREFLDIRPPPKEPDGISTLSCSSSMKKPASSFVSNSDIAAQSDLDVSDPGEEVEEEDEKSLDLHLERYILPPSTVLTAPVSSQKSSSMNRLVSLPAPPGKSNKDSIPSGVAIKKNTSSTSSPHHSSSPNIEFRPGLGVSTTSAFRPSPSPRTAPQTEHPVELKNSFTADTAIPSSSPPSSSSAVIQSSMPVLTNGTNGYHVLETADNGSVKNTPKVRPSSEADLSFSPYKFSQSNC